MREWIDVWDDDFQPVFWEAKRAMLRAAEEVLNEHGVREGQQFILMCLWAQDGLAPGEIARRLGLATPTVTRTATRMATAGLVERRPDPADARVTRIYLTERGRDLRDPLNAAMRAMSERAMGGMTADEQATLVDLLRRLRANLDADGDGARTNHPSD
ncbi:DNA-binding MarR family transcriptional regulator [Lipingzhangella halophila]|uniref:DNA-binding MarR family transcriptional regulator n=1 Tax=Lipingzhangella halophila TaxID=1783352 RepID=A0A7W7RF94_9ACTN|nr:MarR family transcriptional regulator [Lipingzhangella halophila]MBB4930907.1 DNA-binding MarR family transcriptional regulator [Lipingzhangella halophila]